VTALEHTADTGLIAEGPSLEACLARAGAGMLALFLEPPRDAPTTVEIQASGETLEELLVSWLEDLLVASEVDGIAPQSVEVSGVAGGRAWGLLRGRIARLRTRGPAVKAVTRHELSLRRTQRGWEARVYFDV
jgi:SHS2 domain-containing protein